MWIFKSIQIARQVSQGTVSKIAERIREKRNFTVKWIENCGRKSMLSKTTKLRLCINNKEWSDAESKELHDELGDLGKNVTTAIV